MTSLVMIAILLFGLVSYNQLPVNDLPNVDFPTIQINANLSGANPDTMASAVATPLENQLSTIAGVDSMTSSSGIGQTRITIQFSLDRDIDAAAQDVQAAISQAARYLPKNMTTPPWFRKVNPADQPVLAVLYPLLKDQPLPRFASLGGSRGVKIESSFGVDYVLLGLESFRFQGEGIDFDGKAGVVQVRPQGARLSLPVRGWLVHRMHQSRQFIHELPLIRVDFMMDAARLFGGHARVARLIVFFAFLETARK